MQIPDQLRPRLALVRRTLMWTGMALLLFAGLFSSPFGSSGKQAWAAVSACPGQASIPMAPVVLNLVRGQSATYEVSLCQEPTAAVHVTNNVDASDPITVSPPSLTFTSAQTQTVSVRVADSYPADQSVFFVITHTATSADPEFNFGSLNVPTVTVFSPPAGTTNPQIEPVEPEQENEVEFESSVGTVIVTVPPIPGLPDNADVFLSFAEVVTPTGNVNEPPTPLASFTGLTYRLELFVNGEPINPGQLSEPITIEIPLPDELADALGSGRLIVAVWDGTKWTTEGLSIVQNTAPTSEDDVLFTFTTTVFGEFAIFERDNVIFVPYIEAN